jgi:hypothetical protein
LQLAGSIFLLEVFRKEEFQYFGHLVSQHSKPISEFELIVTGPDILIVLAKDYEYFQYPIDHKEWLFWE